MKNDTYNKDIKARSVYKWDSASALNLAMKDCRSYVQRGVEMFEGRFYHLRAMLSVRLKFYF